MKFPRETQLLHQAAMSPLGIIVRDDFDIAATSKNIASARSENSALFGNIQIISSPTDPKELWLRKKAP